MPSTSPILRATDVASRLGLRRYSRSWRGPCPACGYPGTFIVRAGRNGSARPFCVSCWNRDALADAVAGAIGQESQPTRPQDGKKAAARADDRRERALMLWRGSEPAIGTLADRYLTARGLPGLAYLPVLRFRTDTPHPEVKGKFPALIALVVDVAGKPLGVHRTFLARDGLKGRLEPNRASLGPVKGGAIRLHPLAADKPLVIGEGIETAASAGRLLGCPAWSAISAGNLADRLVLPPEVSHVVIAADPDDPGRDAARDAWLRWTEEGRTVQIAIPDGSGDFNDLLISGKRSWLTGPVTPSPISHDSRALGRSRHGRVAAQSPPTTDPATRSVRRRMGGVDHRDRGGGRLPAGLCCRAAACLGFRADRARPLGAGNAGLG